MDKLTHQIFPVKVNYRIPFSAIRTYRASVVRALSNIALDKIAHVPIPTNPKSVLNNLPLAGLKKRNKTC